MQNDKRFVSRPLGLTLIILHSVFCVCLPGCNVLGWVSAAAASEAKTKAAYVLPKRPTVVIAENFANPAEVALDADPIARLIADELRTQDVVPIISIDQVSRLQQSDREKFRQMTIAALGREVGAEQIIYVNIDIAGVETDPGTDALRGRGKLRVRVVDAQTGGTLWPITEAQGYLVSGETRLVRRDQLGGDAATIRSALHRSLASRTAKLFYSHAAELD